MKREGKKLPEQKLLPFVDLKNGGEDGNNREGREVLFDTKFLTDSMRPEVARASITIEGTDKSYAQSAEKSIQNWRSDATGFYD
jgi:hypothetical protein